MNHDEKKEGLSFEIHLSGQIRTRGKRFHVDYFFGRWCDVSIDRHQGECVNCIPCFYRTIKKCTKLAVYKSC